MLRSINEVSGLFKRLTAVGLILSLVSAASEAAMIGMQGPAVLAHTSPNIFFNCYEQDALARAAGGIYKSLYKFGLKQPDVEVYRATMGIMPENPYAPLHRLAATNWKEVQQKTVTRELPGIAPDDEKIYNLITIHDCTQLGLLSYLELNRIPYAAIENVPFDPVIQAVWFAYQTLAMGLEPEQNITKDQILKDSVVKMAIQSSLEIVWAMHRRWNPQTDVFENGRYQPWTASTDSHFETYNGEMAEASVDAFLQIEGLLQAVQTTLPQNLGTLWLELEVEKVIKKALSKKHQQWNLKQRDYAAREAKEQFKVRNDIKRFLERGQYEKALTLASTLPLRSYQGPGPSSGLTGMLIREIQALVVREPSSEKIHALITIGLFASPLENRAKMEKEESRRIVFLKEAEKIILEALKEDETNTHLLFTLARVYGLQHRNNEARNVLIKLADSDFPYPERIKTLFISGIVAEAKRIVKNEKTKQDRSALRAKWRFSWAKDMSLHPSLHYVIGTYFLGGHNFPSAIYHLGKAKKEMPEDRFVAWALGRALFSAAVLIKSESLATRNKQLKEAQQEMDRAIELGHEDYFYKEQIDLLMQVGLESSQSDELYEKMTGPSKRGFPIDGWEKYFGLPSGDSTDSTDSRDKAQHQLFLKPSPVASPLLKQVA